MPRTAKIEPNIPEVRPAEELRLSRFIASSAVSRADYAGMVRNVYPAEI